jgi:hypothetical protein
MRNFRIRNYFSYCPIEKNRTTLMRIFTLTYNKYTPIMGWYMIRFVKMFIIKQINKVLQWGLHVVF